MKVIVREGLVPEVMAAFASPASPETASIGVETRLMIHPVGVIRPPA